MANLRKSSSVHQQVLSSSSVCAKTNLFHGLNVSCLTPAPQRRPPTSNTEAGNACGYALNWDGMGRMFDQTGSSPAGSRCRQAVDLANSSTAPTTDVAWIAGPRIGIRNSSETTVPRPSVVPR